MTRTRTVYPVHLAHEPMAERRPFRAGNITGAFLPEHGPRRTGVLPSVYADAWWQAGTAHGRDLYVVYSYATPIAWITPDGVATIPDVTYSVTTTQHQYAVRHAARLAGWTIAPNPVPERTSLMRGRRGAGAFGPGGQAARQYA